MKKFLFIVLFFICFFQGNPPAKGSQLPPYKPYKEPSYVANPAWQDFHKFPKKEKPVSFGGLSVRGQGDFFLLQQQAQRLKVEVEKAYREIHTPGISTGLYQKKLREEYEEKSKRLKMIEAQLRKGLVRYVAPPMNPLNSIARLLVSGKEIPSQSLYGPHLVSPKG